MQKFRDTFGVCGLWDLGFRGSPYTWCNQRLGTARTFERLDRCVATVEWQQCFTRYEVSHMIPPVSDHLMLKLETFFTPLPCTPKRRHPIRFEAEWTRFEECENIIKQAWDLHVEGNSMYSLCAKIKHCRTLLSHWGKTTLGNLGVRVKKKKKWTSFKRLIMGIWMMIRSSPPCRIFNMNLMT